MVFEVNHQLVMAFVHSWLVEIHYLSQRRERSAELRSRRSAPACASATSSVVSSVLKSLSTPSIASPTESRHFSLGSLDKTDSSAPRIEVNGLFRLWGCVGYRAKLIYRGIQSIQHMIESFGQS